MDYMFINQKIGRENNFSLNIPLYIRSKKIETKSLNFNYENWLSNSAQLRKSVVKLLKN